MNSNMDIMQIMQMLQSGANPKAFLLNLLQQQSGSNPFYANLLKMVQNNDISGLEQIAKNACMERGVNYDEEVSKWKATLGLK